MILTQTFFFFYANHPLQGFRSHCSVRGYSSLLVATAGAEATTRTGRQHTHTHTHTTRHNSYFDMHVQNCVQSSIFLSGSLILHVAGLS